MLESTKILLLGRTASGKDTIAGKLRELYGFTQVLSYTTRLRREGEGDTHTFIAPEEAGSYTDRVAETKIGDIEYFATRQQVFENDIYIIDPPGAYELLRKMPETDFLVVYVETTDELRKSRFTGREKNNTKISFEDRNKAENERFSEFEARLDIRDDLYSEYSNIAGLYIAKNDDTRKLDDICSEIKLLKDILDQRQPELGENDNALS